MIVVRRQTILAEARHGRVATVRVVRVGLGALDLGSAAAAAAASDVPGAGASAPTAEDTMKSLAEAIACLSKDVAMDACSDWYGPECEGKDEEVDQVAACLKKIEMSKAGELTPVTWEDALTCAGVEPTEENKRLFGACVLKKESSQRVPRGTLGVCALQVRRGLASGSTSTAHSTQAWRDGFETWTRQFDVFRQKWETGSAGEVGVYASATGIPMSEVARYAESYNTFRQQFIEAGGTTSCSEIEAGGGGGAWKWWAIGIGILVVGGVVLFKLPAFLGAIQSSHASLQAARLTSAKIKAAKAAAEVAARGGA